MVDEVVVGHALERPVLDRKLADLHALDLHEIDDHLEEPRRLAPLLDGGVHGRQDARLVGHQAGVRHGGRAAELEFEEYGVLSKRVIAPHEQREIDDRRMVAVVDDVVAGVRVHDELVTHARIVLLAGHHLHARELLALEGPVALHVLLEIVVVVVVDDGPPRVRGERAAEQEVHDPELAPEGDHIARAPLHQGEEAGAPETGICYDGYIVHGKSFEKKNQG